MKVGTTSLFLAEIICMGSLSNLWVDPFVGIGGCGGFFINSSVVYGHHISSLTHISYVDKFVVASYHYLDLKHHIHLLKTNLSLIVLHI